MSYSVLFASPENPYQLLQWILRQLQRGLSFSLLAFVSIGVQLADPPYCYRRALPVCL
jgi:hypothetical protein